MNKQLFRIHMLKNNDNQVTLSEALQLPQSAISARINGKTEFRQNEINAIRLRWGLSDAETVDVFFTDEVSEKDTNKKKGA